MGQESPLIYDHTSASIHRASAENITEYSTVHCLETFAQYPDRCLDLAAQLTAMALAILTMAIELQLKACEEIIGLIPSAETQGQVKTKCPFSHSESDR